MLDHNFQSDRLEASGWPADPQALLRSLVLAFVAAVMTGAWGPARAAEYHFCDCQPGAHDSCQAGSDGSTLGSETQPWRSMEICAVSARRPFRRKMRGAPCGPGERSSVVSKPEYR